MTPAKTIENAPQEQPPVPQFSLRSVLLVIAAVAVVCAIAAPWIRPWPLERQLRLIALLGSIAVGVIGGSVLHFAMVVYFVRRSRHSPWCSGRLLIVPKKNSAWTYASTIGNFAFWIFVVVMYARLAVGPAQARQQSQFASAGFHGMPAVVAACATQMFFITYWQARAARICTHGILMGFALFQAWHLIRKYTWTKEAAGKWHMARLWVGHSILDLAVPDAMHDQVDRILAEHAGKAEENPWSRSD